MGSRTAVWLLIKRGQGGRVDYRVAVTQLQVNQLCGSRWRLALFSGFGREGVWNLRLAPDCQRYSPSAKTTGHQMGLYSITFLSGHVVIDVCSQPFYGQAVIRQVFTSSRFQSVQALTEKS